MTATEDSRPAGAATARAAARRLVLACLVLAAVLGHPAAGRASAFSDDLAARRARVMEALGPDTMLVLWSAPPRTYSRDIDYPYRQDSNLYYLTGLDQEDTVLVLMPGNRTHRELLFLSDRDLAAEHWRGRRLDSAAAAERSGVRTVLSRTRFDAFVSAVLTRHAFDLVDERDAERFFDALRDGLAKVALVTDGDTPPPPTPARDFARAIRDRYDGLSVVDASLTLDRARLIKTPYERARLAKSVAISVDAQLAGMRATHPGAYEYQVKAAVDAAHRAFGADGEAYPSIVGSGPNATILHYPEDDRQMRAGELLLVDAGASYEYLAADLTRTYPVSGTFTEPQKDLYRVVLKAWDEGVSVAKANGSLSDIHEKTVSVIKAGLLALGLITDAAGDQYKMWYTHGASHYLGVDVHDPGDRTVPLAAGMAFTIEPGLYIRPEVLDTLPDTAENIALVETIRPAVTRYGGVGIRIEDSFLVDEDGLHNLSAALPRTIEDIERLMSARR